MTGVGHRFDGALQRRIDYRYDVYGNLTEQALDGGAVIESLHYDSLHRLTQTSRSGASSGQVNYGYDAAGNFQYKSDFSTALTNAYAYSGGACGGGPNAVKSVQLKAGGSRSYCYDGAGNLISDNSGMSLRYDASQRPTVMHRGTADSQFRYGPDGDKARQWGSTGQRLYVGGIEDRPDTNETESYLGDYALIQTSPSGRKVQYLLRDRLGSVIGVADDAGAVEWRGFDAFGAPRSGNWADKSPNILGPNAQTAHGFTQHEHLDGLGLIHMNGRVYDYALGRFLGVDPFIQFPGNSQSLNPYSYILNNPLAGTDPTGYQIADPRTLCARSQSACNSTNSSSDLSAFTNAGGGGRQQNNGRTSGTGPTGRRGTNSNDASNTEAPGGRRNAPTLGEQATSVSLDLTPVVGSLKSVAQLFTGTDLVTGEKVSRPIEAVGILAGLFPAGKFLTRGEDAAEVVIDGAKLLRRSDAATGGAAAVRVGRAGEDAVRAVFDIGPKELIRINGRGRIPDGLTNEVLSEVKNVQFLSFTRQLRDFADFAEQNGRRFDLFLRPNTRVSGPLQDAIDRGIINRLDIPQ